MDDAIATTRMIAIHPNGLRVAVAVMIGRPQPTESEAACTVYLEGIDTRPRPIYGEDTFQSLALAARYVRNRLNIEEERGVRLVDNEGGPVDWRRCWFSEE